ncbi:MAG: ABC transporter permease, partial [Anaerolineae bacterium]
MSALLQKIKADITRRPLSSLLITLTIAASATLLTLALATLTNLSAPYDQSFEDLNAAHLWLYFDRDRVRRRDIAWIESLPGVVESTGLQRSVLNRVRVGDTRVWVSLRAIGSPPPVVNRLLVQNGREPAPHHPELLAGKEMNDLYRLAVGEAVGLTRADGKTVYWPVVGLAYNPMWDTYRNTQPPYLYLTEESLRQLYPDEDRWDWSLGLRLADPDGVDDMLARIEDGLRAGAVATHTDWQDVRESAIFGAQLNFALLGAFSFFAIAATVLVITGSISATVLSQFRQIGILKAIGFTQRQVVLLYVGQYLLLAVAGTTAGLVLGAALAPLPLKSIAVSLNAAYRPPLNAGL